jgi:iron complex outermembrane receptor protein
MLTSHFGKFNYHFVHMQIVRTAPWRISALAMVLASNVVLADESTAPPAAPPAAPTSPSAETTYVTPAVEVISTSPLLGSGIDADKVPNATKALRAKDIRSNGGPPSVTNALKDQVGSVNVDSTFGNPYQPDLTFRGFVASPVVGVPQGFAVYVNGVRVNEAFGDTVNWDLIPDFAIDSMNLTSTNPVFGFNALGGAAAIELKNGFTFQGGEAEGSTGSFHRSSGIVQYGKSWGDWAVYFGASPSYEKGWRDYSPSRTDKFYTDLGYDNGHKSLHLSYAYANNSLNGMGPTPEYLLNQNWGAGVDYPGNSLNVASLLTLRGNLELSKTQSLQGNAYYRSFRQDYINGTPLGAQACTTGNTANLCMQDASNNFTVPVLDQFGNGVPVSALNGLGLGSAFPAYDAKSHTQTNTVGGTVQTTSTAPIADHENQWVVGASWDHSTTDFSSGSLLGAFDATRAVVPSALSVSALGVLNNVSLLSTTDYAGLYLTDTFNLTSDWALTASGRFNYAALNLSDRLGGSLNGYHKYDRFNPALGATYKISPTVTAYADYAESNRIPSAAELSCASPSAAC